VLLRLTVFVKSAGHSVLDRVTWRLESGRIAPTEDVPARGLVLPGQMTGLRSRHIGADSVIR
jgi:hypothetical protein